MTALDRALVAPKNLTREELVRFLSSGDAGVERDLFAAARELKHRLGKDAILPRGLIECSNTCAKNCLYCGIRKDNGDVVRYRIPEPEALACCDEARRRGYPAVAFQAGEIESEANTAYYERLLAGCRDLEVTLSLGEQTEAVYRRWKDAGALRYLIRIETSNRALFSKIHPTDCSFERRLGCIRTLKRLGYVTGSGVMIGLPGQTIGDLAQDILFFGEEDLDMVGMGPFIPTPGTPMERWSSELELERGGILLAGRSTLRLSLRMIALARLYLHRVNIVAATALEALDPAEGRDLGIRAGANVIMTNLTPARYRENYNLYPGKVSAVS